MKILVTGGAGFIGSAVVRHIIRDTDWTVANVDKLTYAGNLESLAETRDSNRHTHFKVDIVDRAAVDGVFASFQPDAVLHLAAESHVDRSTDEVFGSLGATGRFSETTPYAPNSPYAASKAASDHLVRAWHHTHGLPTLATNCSNNYGPYHFPEKLIPLTIIRALRGQSLPVYGKGENVRDWLHVEDHAEALTLVLRTGKPGETYNVGGDSERKNI